MDLDGSNSGAINNTFGLVDDIEVDVANQHVYVASRSLNHIWRCDLDGSNEEQVTNIGNNSWHGMALGQVI